MFCIFTYVFFATNLLRFHCCKCLVQSDFISATQNIYYKPEYEFLCSASRTCGHNTVSKMNGMSTNAFCSSRQTAKEDILFNRDLTGSTRASAAVHIDQCTGCLLITEESH